VQESSAQAPPPVARSLAGKLAVLDFKNYTTDLQPEQVRYFTDVVRSAAVRAGPRLEVMTRENLLVLMQAQGRDLAACQGECEVETGRLIGADLIVSGDLQRIGKKLKLSMRLHETHGGRLMAADVASGRDIDELDTNAQTAAAALLAGARQ
jgi:TolB-like protein